MYDTNFNKDTNQLEAACPVCGDFTSDGVFLETMGYCTDCDLGVSNFWMDKLALAQ